MTQQAGSQDTVQERKARRLYEDKKNRPQLLRNLNIDQVHHLPL